MKKILAVVFCMLTLIAVGCGSGSSSASAANTSAAIKQASSAPK